MSRETYREDVEGPSDFFFTLFSFLTQLNKEWIKGLAWAWSVVSVFLVYLTPFASRTRKNTESHTSSESIQSLSEAIFHLKHRFNGLFSSPLLHFRSWPDSKEALPILLLTGLWQASGSGAPPSVCRCEVHLFVSPASAPKKAHYRFTLIHCADYIPAISWSVVFFSKGKRKSIAGSSG